MDGGEGTTIITITSNSNPGELINHTQINIDQRIDQSTDKSNWFRVVVADLAAAGTSLLARFLQTVSRAKMFEPPFCEHRRLIKIF